MTDGEAYKVAKILMEADGGCPTCAYRLIVKFVEAFPDHEKTAWEVFPKPTAIGRRHE